MFTCIMKLSDQNEKLLFNQFTDGIPRWEEETLKEIIELFSTLPEVRKDIQGQRKCTMEITRKGESFFTQKTCRVETEAEMEIMERIKDMLANMVGFGKHNFAKNNMI